MKYFVGFLAIMVLALGAYVFTQPEAQTQPAQLAGSTGATFYSPQYFLGDETIGGNIIASSTSASVTLSGKEFINSNTLDYMVNVGSVTLTLPASTTPMCSSLTKNERRTVFIRNATTSASVPKITIAGGTGILLKAGTSTAQILGNTDGSNFGSLTIIRKANSDCDAFFGTYN